MKSMRETINGGVLYSSCESGSCGGVEVAVAYSCNCMMEYAEKIVAALWKKGVRAYLSDGSTKCSRTVALGCVEGVKASDKANEILSGMERKSEFTEGSYVIFKDGSVIAIVADKNEFTSYKQEVKKEKEERRKEREREKQERKILQEDKLLLEVAYKDALIQLENIFNDYFEKYPYEYANTYLHSKSAYNTITHKIITDVKTIEDIPKKAYFQKLNEVGKLYKYEEEIEIAQIEYKNRGWTIAGHIILKIFKILVIAICTPFILAFIMYKLIGGKKI